MKDQGPTDHGMPITMSDDMPEPFEWIDDCITCFRRWVFCAAVFCVLVAITIFTASTFYHYFK